MSGATNSALAAEYSAKSGEDDDIQLTMFQSEESQDELEVEPIGHRGGISDLSEPSLKGSQQECDRSLQSLAKASLQMSHLQDSSDAVSVPTSISYMAGTGATLEEPGIGPEIGVAPRPVFADIQPAAPNSLMRAKAGHYMARSSLVATDTEDMERHANAMTNGKGDWRKRVTQMLQVLSAPPKNRTLTKGSPSSIAPEASTAQDLAAASMPNSISDTPKKRKFSEFNAEALRPNSGRPSSFSSQNRQGMLPKERREEHARKRQVKQEALEKAKAEADALRRQVEEIEAGQAEAIAREEAEVSQNGHHSQISVTDFLIA